MSESVTLEALAKRVDAVEAQLAAKAPPWLAFVKSINHSDEAMVAQRVIDEAMRLRRVAERVEQGLDEPAAPAHGDAALSC